MKIKKIVTAICMFIAINTVAQKASDYKPGYYFDRLGNKIAGLIYYDYSYVTHFRFKADEKSKAKKIEPTKATGFVVGSDSFIVLRNFMMEGLNGGLQYIPEDFVKVIATGKLNLYADFSNQGSGSKYGDIYDLSTFILVKNNGSPFTVKRKEKKFIKEMKAYFADDAEIAKGIEESQFKYEDMPKIVALYNSRH